jgi:cytochrome c6
MIFFSHFLFFLISPFIINYPLPDLKTGEKLFISNCITCHANGNNIIIPEKSLKKEILQTNGMDTKNAIIYQIMNGKNGMPAFGGRLKKIEIEAIANYVLENCDSFGS